MTSTISVPELKSKSLKSLLETQVTPNGDVVLTINGSRVIFTVEGDIILRPKNDLHLGASELLDAFIDSKLEGRTCLSEQ